MQPRISFLAALAALACSAGSDSTARTPTMPTDAAANKQAVRRLYEDCINPGRLDRLAELISDDFVGAHGERGPAAYAATVTGLRTGFPDLRFTVEDVVAEADRVAIRWTWHGTHSGPFAGLTPSGKSVTNSGIAIYQLANHKIIRVWFETDRLGALQQLGVVPATLGKPPAPPAQPH